MSSVKHYNYGLNPYNMKWITSTDIKHWADTHKAQGLLPELVCRLIRATSTKINKLRFPNGDAIHLNGWDGVLDSEERIYQIDSGISLWECGVNADPKDKANKDYYKRTNNSIGYNKSESTFVFVTPRIWNGAVNWVNEKKENREWKDVVVITAVELEEWLSLCPAVALWFARLIGRSIKKAYNLELYWNKWSSGKRIKLKPSILLGGRYKEQQEIYKCIAGSSIAIVQSIAQSESLAFAVACILSNPQKDDLIARSIVVEDDETLEELIDTYSNIIFIANVGRKHHTYGAENGHCIIYATNATENFNYSSNATVLQLPLIDRDEFIKSLEESGINKTQAEELSRQTARNITILRRTLEIDYSCPEWANPENIRELIPAILVARWSETQEGDKEIISLIAGEPYDSYIKKLHKWSHKDDAPLVTIEGKWRIFSPFEAFGYAANYIVDSDFSNYQKAIELITNDNDPDAIEKMKSTGLRFWTHRQRYSNWIKEGLYQTAIMISLSEKRSDLNTTTSPTTWVDNIISSVLNSSTIEWWLSNKHIIGLIAEASPQSFIDYITTDLRKEESIIKMLFTPKGSNGLMGPSEDYTHILFSLQAMIWDNKLILPISCILADLCSIENNTNLYNKPINALYEAFAIWHPQTYARTNERLETLKTISKKYPAPAFNLCFKLLDRLHLATVTSTHPMKWRCYNYSYANITRREIRDSIKFICNLIISLCDNSEGQICKILELASQSSLGRDNREVLFKHILTYKDKYIGNFTITDAIRDTIYRHTTYSDTEWALSKQEIDKWIALLSELESDYLLDRHRWIFKNSHVDILGIDKRHCNWDDAFEQIRLYKYKALAEIEELYGFNGITEFVKKVGCPIEVGEAYAYKADAAVYLNVLDLLLKAREESIVNFAKGFFSRYTFQNGINNIISLINSLNINKYIDIINIPLTVMPCSCREMWTFIETLPTSLQTEYWTNINVGYTHEEDSEYIVEKLIDYKRYDKALDIIYYSHKKATIPANIIEKTVIGLLSINDHDLIQLKSYELAEVIYALDKMDTANIQVLYSLEFAAYRILEQFGNINETKFIKGLMTRPENMMEVIEKVYLSSDEDEVTQELEQINHIKSYATLCCHILFSLRKTPFTDDDNNINEQGLNDYIEQLQTLGKAKHKIKGVNTVIGELLGNYPESESYPPLEICEIIEKYNNQEINEGFRTRIINKRGVTIRGALEGGTLEIIESKKYRRYADKVRYTHPIVCRIFDDISNSYSYWAKTEDTKVTIEKMEY